MKILFLNIIVCFIVVITHGQTVIDQKGTRIIIDSSKWKYSGNNIYNYENNSYNNWNTGGTRTSTDGAGSTTAFDIRPQFFNVIYVMRVV